VFEPGWLKYEALEITADGPVRIVTMNRPDALNAADAVMHRELAEVWGLLAADPDCRAVVLTGAGRAFSAGGDLPRMLATQQDPEIQDEVFDEARRTVLPCSGRC
jgi:enoyl-CoA hydratase